MLPTDSPKEGESLPYFLASSSSEEWHLLDQNERSHPSEGDNDGSGFDDLMSRLQAAMKTNCAGIEVPKRAVLESQLKTNPYFDALRSVLEEEKQRDEKRKIDLKELKCLANSLTNLIGQQLEETPAQEAEEENANGGEESGEDGKRMGTAVEQKMAEYAAFCHFDSSEGKAKKEEAEEAHCPIRAKMRECLRKSQQIEQQIEENTEICVGRARNLLGLQARLRPISDEDVAQFESVIQLSAQLWREELRDAVCSHLLLLKALGASERKKRQNFSVQTISLLNHYFMQHLDQPYPDEQTKLALAEQCGITLAQVSNWFGNKRIRFRKAAQQKRLKESLEAEEEKQLGEGEEEEEVDDGTAGPCREVHGKKAKNCK